MKQALYALTLCIIYRTAVSGTAQFVYNHCCLWPWNVCTELGSRRQHYCKVCLFQLTLFIKTWRTLLKASECSLGLSSLVAHSNRSSASTLHMALHVMWTLIGCYGATRPYLAPSIYISSMRRKDYTESTHNGNVVAHLSLVTNIRATITYHPPFKLLCVGHISPIHIAAHLHKSCLHSSVKKKMQWS